MKNFISIRDFSQREIDDLIREAKGMIPCAKEGRPPMRVNAPLGGKVTFLFTEASTRTFGSYNEAARIWGFERDHIRGKEASLMKGESFSRTIVMLAQQRADIIVMRTSWEGAARFAVEVIAQMRTVGDLKFNVSIQNAGDGSHDHPSQGILDSLTIEEKLGQRSNFTLGILFSGRSRSINSLLDSLRERDITLVCVMPPGIELERRYRKGFSRIITADSVSAFGEYGCDVVYLNRIQKERFKETPELLQEIEGWQRQNVISKKILDSLKEGALVMHPQPCREEVDPEIFSDSRVIIDDQSWYGLPTRMVLLERGYNHRNDPVTIERPERFTIDTKEEAPAQDRIEAKRKKGIYFLPIPRGTILDHLRPITVNMIRLMLAKLGIVPLGAEGIIPAEGLPSTRYRRKDVLQCRNIFIPDEASCLVTLISPNTTVNIVDGGTLKKQVVSIPQLAGGYLNIIKGHLRCPNEDCITNFDPEADPGFHTQKADGNMYLTCHYCDREFTGGEVVFHTLGMLDLFQMLENLRKSKL